MPLLPLRKEDNYTSLSHTMVAAGIGEQEYSTKVYNLQGVKVADSLEGLPQGIYIVNKKKVIVK